MVESFANASNENAARQIDGEFAVTKGDQKHDSRSLENIFGLPGKIEESSSTTQAGYELTRNNWDLVAQADMLTSGKFSNYGLDRWDLDELASNPCYPLDAEQRESIKYLANNLEKIAPQGRLSAAAAVKFASESVKSIDANIKLPEGIEDDTPDKRAATIAKALDAGDDIGAARKFQKASQLMNAGEFRDFVLAVNRQEKDQTGSDLELYDSQGNETSDENTAKGFSIGKSNPALEKNMPNNSIGNPAITEVDPAVLAKELDGSESAVVAEKLAKASQTMSQSDFGNLIKNVNRLEKDGTGGDILLLDSAGNPTNDDASAVGYDVKLPVTEKTAGNTDQPISANIDNLVKTLESGDIEAASAELTRLRKGMPEAEFKKIIIDLDTKEVDGVGVDIQLLDAKGQNTKAPEAAASFTLVAGQTKAKP